MSISLITVIAVIIGAIFILLLSRCKKPVIPNPPGPEPLPPEPSPEPIPDPNKRSEERRVGKEC